MTEIDHANLPAQHPEDKLQWPLELQKTHRALSAHLSHTGELEPHLKGYPS